MPEKIDRVNIEGVTYDIEPVMERTVQPGNVSKTVTTDAVATAIENVYSSLNNKKQNKRLEPPLEVCGEEEVFIEEAVKSMADCKDVPEEGSGKFFTTGGAQADKATSFSDQSRKNFISANAYKVFAKSSSAESFLGKVFGPRMCRVWKESNLIYTTLPPVLEMCPLMVKFAAGIFVAAMRKGRCWYSKDGKTWWSCYGIYSIDGSSSDMTVSINAVEYGSGIWVAASVDNGLWWSADGKNYVHSDQTSTVSFYSVKFANGFWVAASAQGLWWSSNGKSWTKTVSSSASSRSFRIVEYGGGIWLAGAMTNGSSNAGCWWSEDGKTWTQTTSYTGATALTDYRLHNFCYGNGLWLAASVNVNTSYLAGLWYSSDGKTWQLTSETGLHVNSFGAYYGDGIWRACASGSMTRGAYWSYDGINWTPYDSGLAGGTGSPYGYNNNGIFANGLWLSGNGAYSDDNINWVKPKLPAGHDSLTSLCYANGAWIGFDFGRLPYRLMYSSIAELGLKD